MIPQEVPSDPFIGEVLILNEFVPIVTSDDVIVTAQAVELADKKIKRLDSCAKIFTLFLID